MVELKALTGLRFLAAFLVFAFHLHLYNLLPSLPWFVENIVAEGSLGVNLFFALSGFLLTYSHLKDYPIPRIKSRTYFYSFIIKRIARIYPALITGCIFLFALTVYMQSIPPDFNKIFVLDALLLNAWVPTHALAWFGGGSWSVSTEMFFYSVFPFMLPLLLQVTSKKNLLLLLGCCILAATLPGLFLSTFLRANKFDPVVYSWIYVWPLARLPEFVSGIITALLVFRFNWKISTLAVTGALLTLTLYLVKFGPALLGHMGHNGIVLPVIILILAYLARQPKNWVICILESNLMVYLGQISYGFYIWQIILFFTLEKAGLQLEFGKYKHFIFLILLFLLNLFFAIVSYHFVERPGHKWILQNLLPRNKLLPTNS